MKHLSLLALLPSGAATGKHAGPSAADLAAHVLSHTRHDSATGIDAPRATYKNVSAMQVLTDEYVFPLGDTGDSLVLSGTQIAAGFLAVGRRTGGCRGRRAPARL